MRSAIFALLPLLIVANSFGQGIVSFHNDGASAVTNGLTGQRAAAGGAFKAVLYYAFYYDSIVPAESALIPIGNAVDLDPPGYIIGPNVKTPNTYVPGRAAYFQVRVWEAAYGATYEQAISAPPMNGRGTLRGVSNIVRVLSTGDPDYPLIDPGHLTFNGLQGFILTVPETPQLRIVRSGLDVVISWASTNASFHLEFAAVLAAGTNWSAVTNAVAVNGNERSVVVNAASATRFYRLKQP
jgi:hypothetical protein